MNQQIKKEDNGLPEKKKMEALGRLSCKVAHDFNNILGAIEGYATLAMGALKADDPVRADLQEIRISVAKAAAIGKHLTAFGGRQLLHKARCEVRELVANTLKRAELAQDEKFKIEERLEAGLPGLIADAAQLEQALAGLLVNAREAMPGGGTAVISSCASKLEAGDIGSPKPEEAGSLFIKITVSDSGAGISAEALEHLFEPMFSTTKKGLGTGFGLALVYGLARQHNGWVEAKSEPGRGSEFTLYLPASGI
ncbi:MAG: ATP-binding protein [Elusimicrobiales bacterium]|nr:ATP-binding protein [Elusimicrobiales bacterium]